MIYTKEQFAEIGPMHLDDLCVDLSDEDVQLRVFNLLPDYIQGEAVKWDFSDTCVRDDVFAYLVEKLFGLTVKEYYARDMERSARIPVDFAKLEAKVNPPEESEIDCVTTLNGRKYPKKMMAEQLKNYVEKPRRRLFGK